MRKIFVVAGLSASAMAMLAGSRPQPVAAQDAADKPAYFVEKVQPILQQNCARCHLDGNTRGGLSLATKADMLRGGAGGPALVPGDPESSVLVKVIKHDADHPPMPPGGQSIGAENIAIIANWVKAGAIMPDPPPGAMAGGPRNGGGPGGMGGGGMGGGRQTMDLPSAKKILAAIEAEAEKTKQHVAMCVMDTNGDIVAFERMNGTDRIPLTTSEGKARAVLMFGIPTAKIAEAQRDKKPLTATVTAPPIGIGGGSGITLMAGGLPIYKDGKMIGSVGVGGSASEEDERFARVGVEAAGLSSSATPSPAK